MSQCIDLFPWDKRAEKGLDNDSRDLRMFCKGNAGNSSGSKVYSGQTNPNVLKPLSSDSDTCLHGYLSGISGSNALDVRRACGYSLYLNVWER